MSKFSIASIVAENNKQLPDENENMQGPSKIDEDWCCLILCQLLFNNIPRAVEAITPRHQHRPRRRRRQVAAVSLRRRALGMMYSCRIFMWVVDARFELLAALSTA